MKRVFPFVLLSALLLTACEPRDSTLSDTSSNISVGSDIIGGSYEERISTMADTGVAIDLLDKTEKEVAFYDELAPLGSAAHPLSNSSAEYLEILTFEQPSQYGDAYLFRAGEATIAMDFGHPSNYKYTDQTSYYSELKNTYETYIDDSHLDLLILTHPHGDHYGGYQALKDAIDSVGMIVDYGYYSGGGENYRKNIRNYYADKGSVYHRIYDNVNEIDGGQKRTYITPDLFIDWLDTGYYTENYNDGPVVDDINVTSLAGILAYRDFTFFFSGDLQDNADGYNGGSGGLGETNLVAINGDNNEIFHEVTMMKAAHHSSSKANNDILLNTLEPKLVTISAGAPSPDTSYGGKTGACAGHPHLQALSRFLTKGQKRVAPKIYLNFVNGTTSFVTDGLNKVYMEGSPLKMSYYGTSTNGTVSQTYGSIEDIYNDILSSEWARVCHGL